MNAAQRRKAFRERLRENLSHTCPECGQPGRHRVWMPDGNPVIDALADQFGVTRGGFWTCAKGRSGFPNDSDDSGEQGMAQNG